MADNTLWKKRLSKFIENTVQILSNVYVHVYIFIMIELHMCNSIISVGSVICI